MIKKLQLRKAIVIVISTSFILFNAASSYAQTMTPSTDDDSTTDTTDMTDTATGDTSVIDVIENTDSEETVEEPVEEPEEESGGGGGGGGGAIVGLVVIGAVVVFALSRKKSPKIQKTLVSDKVSGYGTQFVELSNTSSAIENSIAPQLSFQYGSYQSLAGFNKPYSFFNVRTSKALGSTLSIYADAGTKLSYRNDNDAENSQWLIFGLQTKNVLQKNDQLEFFAKYSTADNDQQRLNLLGNGVDLQGHDSLFSDENSRFELAYSRALSQNQRLRFLLGKTGSSSSEEVGYQAKIAWRYAF